jgi:hypothetical protein
MSLQRTFADSAHPDQNARERFMPELRVDFRFARFLNRIADYVNIL